MYIFTSSWTKRTDPQLKKSFATKRSPNSWKHFADFLENSVNYKSIFTPRMLKTLVRPADQEGLISTLCMLQWKGSWFLQVGIKHGCRGQECCWITEWLSTEGIFWGIRDHRWISSPGAFLWSRQGAIWCYVEEIREFDAKHRFCRYGFQSTWSFSNFSDETKTRFPYSRTSRCILKILEIAKGQNPRCYGSEIFLE